MFLKCFMDDLFLGAANALPLQSQRRGSSHGCISAAKQCEKMKRDSSVTVNFNSHELNIEGDAVLKVTL